MLPPKVIQGFSVRDYAYQWISGCCLIHQWASGGKGIDRDVISYVKEEIVKARSWGGHEEKDVQGLIELLQYLIHNEGAPAETYVPDQWADSKEIK